MSMVPSRLMGIAGGRRWLWLLGAVLIAGSGYLFLRPASADADAYTMATVERGDLRTAISATGTLQAVLTVQVGSQVTGRIRSLHADFNSIVKQGQVIARIDPATFEAALIRAKADREDARAGITTARAALSNQNANFEAAVATLNEAGRNYRRTEELAKEGVASEQDLQATQATWETAQARHKQAQAQVESAEAAIEQATARVKQTEAEVTLAEVNLNYTVITSPVDGVVVSRNVDVGQTVAASLQAPTLFVIANDLTRMQVLANVDEADIGHIGPDARVVFTVDSFPGEFFRGSIDQIRLNPVVTQNVVTYSVIINVANPELKLRPGMTANTTFTVAESRNALKMPNAAMRFWPMEVSRERERELLASAPDEPETPETAAQPPHGEDRRQADGSSSPIASTEGVLRFPQIRKVRWHPRIVWIKGDGGAAQPRVVRVGITDGSSSEVMDGDLKEGDQVIIGAMQAASAADRPNNPFGSPLGARPGMKAGGASTGRRP
ncbi:MAG TPA: efflux RND transporter periplasmic adaptor subunit [Candidatus Polarisedimenticolia bacterium]|jgi:HlyD family secretion protein